MPELATQLRTLEEQLLQTMVRTDAMRLDALLADDFVEFGSSGRVWNKQAIIDALRDEPPIERQLHDFELKLLGPDVALVTYRVERGAGLGDPGQTTLRSSVWQRDGETWRLVFHQGTPVPAPHSH